MSSLFFFCKDGCYRLMKRASYSCCIFLCVVLAVTCSKYRRYLLLCLPFVWHFLFNVTHTHTSLFFYSVRLAVIDWWNGALCSCSIFLCNVLAATWSVAGIACRACCSSSTFFSLWHTHTRVRTHTHMCMLDGLFSSFLFLFFRFTWVMIMG